MLFNIFFENENIEENIGKTNKIDPYSLLIDTFKEMTKYIEDHNNWNQHPTFSYKMFNNLYYPIEFYDIHLLFDIFWVV